MPGKIIVVGAGGHAKVILDLLEHIPGCNVVGLLDDEPEKRGTNVLGFRVLGPISCLEELASGRVTAAAVALGDNALRERYFKSMRDAGLETPTLIHPSAVISRHAQLGQGVVVLAGVVVNAGTIIGDNVCLNTGCSIDHDCRLESHSHIFPNAVLTGGVHVKNRATVGSNAVVHPGITIGKDGFVGSGSVVLRDVVDREVVAGNPARRLRIASPEQARCAEAGRRTV